MIFFVVVFGLLVGCTPPKQPAGENNSGSTGAANGSQSAAQATLPPLEINPTIADTDRPKTIEDFQKIFIERLASNPRQACIDFADWSVIPDAKRNRAMQELMVFTLSRQTQKPNRIKGVNLDDIVAYCRDIDLPVEEFNKGRPIPITYVLTVEYDLGSNTTGYATFDIGVRDGMYFLSPLVE